MTTDKANPQEPVPCEGGALIWFTGPPGSGKSTLALGLRDEIVTTGRKVSVLDGDIIRNEISRDLGFSRADRDEQVRRVGEMARGLVLDGHWVLAALVSPYREARDRVRKSLAPHPFLEIHCDCPLDILIQRDPKGMYARALAGEIQNFTGIDDPYEPPLAPERRVLTGVETVSESLYGVQEALVNAGLLER